jgi:hypothetical protein
LEANDEELRPLLDTQAAEFLPPKHAQPFQQWLHSSTPATTCLEMSPHNCHNDHDTTSGSTGFLENAQKPPPPRKQPQQTQWNLENQVVQDF